MDLLQHWSRLQTSSYAPIYVHVSILNLMAINVIAHDTHTVVQIRYVKSYSFPLRRGQQCAKHDGNCIPVKCQSRTQSTEN